MMVVLILAKITRPRSVSLAPRTIAFTPIEVNTARTSEQDIGYNAPTLILGVRFADITNQIGPGVHSGLRSTHIVSRISPLSIIKAFPTWLLISI